VKHEADFPRPLVSSQTVSRSRRSIRAGGFAWAGALHVSQAQAHTHTNPRQYAIVQAASRQSKQKGFDTMNRQQRRYQGNKLHRETVPAYYLLYSPQAKSYLAGVDAENEQMSFSDEGCAAVIFSEEDAKAIVEDLRFVSGVQLSIHPRYTALRTH
jgi:hypothetical protein